MAPAKKKVTPAAKTQPARRVRAQGALEEIEIERDEKREKAEGVARELRHAVREERDHERPGERRPAVLDFEPQQQVGRQPRADEREQRQQVVARDQAERRQQKGQQRQQRGLEEKRRRAAVAELVVVGQGHAPFADAVAEEPEEIEQLQVVPLGDRHALVARLRPVGVEHVGGEVARQRPGEHDPEQQQRNGDQPRTRASGPPGGTGIAMRGFSRGSVRDRAIRCTSAFVSGTILTPLRCLIATVP